VHQQKRLHQIEIAEGAERQRRESPPVRGEPHIRAVSADRERVVESPGGCEHGRKRMRPAPELVAQWQPVAPYPNEHQNQ